jgi:hypothetical protein
MNIEKGEIMKRKISYRKISQIVFFAFIGIVVVNNGLQELGNGLPYIPALSLHAICPFGGVETLYTISRRSEIMSKTSKPPPSLF